MHGLKGLSSAYVIFSTVSCFPESMLSYLKYFYREFLGCDIKYNTLTFKCKQKQNCGWLGPLPQTSFRYSKTESSKFEKHLGKCPGEPHISDPGREF